MRDLGNPDLHGNQIGGPENAVGDLDLEDTASIMVGYAISRADLANIPVQGSHTSMPLGPEPEKNVS